GLIHFNGSTQTLCNIITGQLDVQAPWVSSSCLGNFKETSNFAHNVFKATGLIAVGSCNGVTVHWIVYPKRCSSSSFDAFHNGRQFFANSVRSHAHDEGQTTWFAVRVKLFHQLHGLINGGRSPWLPAESSTTPEDDSHAPTSAAPTTYARLSSISTSPVSHTSAVGPASPSESTGRSDGAVDSMSFPMAERG